MPKGRKMKINPSAQEIREILDKALSVSYLDLNIGEPKKNARKLLSKAAKKLSRQLYNDLRDQIKKEQAQKRHDLRNFRKQKKKKADKSEGVNAEKM